MNEALDAPEGVDDSPFIVSLRPPAHRIERRAIGWWTIRAAVRWSVTFGLLAACWAVLPAARVWLTPLLAVCAVAAVLTIAVAPTWRYAVHRWETTDDAVYAVSGWLVRQWKVIPISRIQSIDTVHGPVQQMLRLSTLTVTTASRQGTLYLPGLDRDTAAAEAQRLTTITQRTPGDAT